MSRMELYRLFRQATVIAGLVGERALTFVPPERSFCVINFHEEKHVCA